MLIRHARSSFVAFALALTSAGGLPAGGKPFDQVVPEGATVFLSFRDVAAFRRWTEEGPLAEALRSPGVESFWRQTVDALQSEFDDQGRQAFRDLGDLVNLLQGEVALVVGDMSKVDFTNPKGQEVPFAFLADVSRDAEKAKNLLDRAITRRREKPDFRVREEEFRGMKIRILDKKQEKDDESDLLYLATPGDIFVLSGSKAFLQDILANRTESAMKPLSEHPDYRFLEEKHGKEASFVGYANWGRLAESLPKMIAAGQGAAGAQQAAMIVPGVLGLLGLSNVKALWLSSAFGKEEASSTFHCLVSGPPRGLLKTIWTRPQPLRFPAFIPDDVSESAVVQVNFDALWETIEGLVKFGMMVSGMTGEGGPEGAQDPVAMVEAQLGIKFKQDLIAPLGGQILEYGRIQKPINASSAQMAFLVELKDRERFQSTLDKLLANVPVFKKGDYLGRPIYTLKIDQEAGDFPDEEEKDGDGEGTKSGGTGGSVPSIALAVTENHLLIGIPGGLAEEVIRRIGKEVKSVNDSPGFKAVAGHYPASASFLSYQTTDYIEYLFELMRTAARELNDSGEEEVAEPLETKKAARIGTPDAMRSLLQKMPPAALFTKPILGFVGYGSTDERGLSYTTKVIFRKKS